MPKISIIIPVYNSENYIERCMESLVNQTLEDIEIIVVDDGSTDNSYSILERFAKKDSRIKIIQQENAKQGAARNNGLRNALGDYITFVDIDDWISLDFCEKMLSTIEKTGADFVVSSAYRIKSNGKKRKYTYYDEEKIYTEQNDIIKTIKIPETWSVWSKLYKKEILNNIFFEEGTYYEDIEFLLKAVNNTKKIATVPNTYYYYFSNPTSTIKSKHSIAKRQDQINAKIKAIKFANENNILLPPICIKKESGILFSTKYYEDYKEVFFLKHKICRIEEKYNTQKVFLIFNTGCFGDILLCNSLSQNIKNIFPDSKVIFITAKNWDIIAKHQLAVDEVFVYDKKGTHKGFGGLLKFIKEFKYKNIYASFVTYKNERNYLIAKLLKSEFVFMENKEHKNLSVQWKHTLLFQNLLSKKVVNKPIKYNLPDDVKNLIVEEKYIVISPITKREGKNIPLDTTLEFVKKVSNETDYKIVFIGTGEIAQKYAYAMDKEGYSYINMINKTTLLELGAILKESCVVISGDTGPLHFACALGAPTVAVYYEDDHVGLWAPSESLYNTKLISREQTAENIYNAMLEVINKGKENV